MIPLETLLWVPVITLLLTIPFACYKDWKERRIPHDFWKWVAGINIPVTCAILYYGFYEWWMFIPSIVAIAIWFITMKLHLIEGADFMFLMWISLFFIHNPISTHILMALPFTIFFAASSIVTGIIIVLYNFIYKNKLSVALDNGIPMIFPISAALILTVMLA